MQNTNYFIENLSKLNITISSEQIDQFNSYYDLVIENNKLFNLTAITEEKDFINKHYIDSLIGSSKIPRNANVLDIGSGAGFPTIPLAIVRPDITVTALDSTGKKMTFVQNSAKQIGLSNVKTIIGRAEELTSYKNTFDVVTARAVSSLQILLELAIPLLKTGGLFLAYKTDESELATINNALKELNTSYVDSKHAQLPNGDNRAILCFKKMAQTNSKYPRKYGVIKKNPL